MRQMLFLAMVTLVPLAACTTTEGGKEEHAKSEPAAAPKESWLEKTGHNAEKEAKKLQQEGLPYYNSCKAEVDKYCKSELKDLPKLADCMKKNQDKFTPGCKAAYDKYKAEHKG